MEPSQPLPPKINKPTRIILVDDHQIVRECIRMLLKAETDMEVIAEAATGQEVLRQTQKLLPDIVIMDVSMPGLNGIEATRQLLSISPWIRVIALTMHSDRQFVLGMFRSGASGYLLKDCSKEELLQAIRAVANKKTYISPGISGIVIADFIIGGQDRENSAYSILTSREREVLQLMAEGKSTAQIAGCLYISIKTIESHRKQIMDKLSIHTVAGLTKYAVRQGLTSM
jgi:two-component system, NarL family, response regulator NreC